MSDRLAELRRQRALVQQHVEWLDREIAAETARLNPAQAGAKIAAVVAAAAPAVATTPAVMPSAVAAPIAKTLASNPSLHSTPPVNVPEVAADPEAERILDEFRTTPGSLHQDVRKGCFLYFAAALALLAAIVALLYFTLPHKEIRPRADGAESEQNGSAAGAKKK
jgi:hypothetical protein